MAEKNEFGLADGESKSERIRRLMKHVAEDASFRDYHAGKGVRAASTGGAALDAAINALSSRVDANEAAIDDLDERVLALEEGSGGGGTDPGPDPEPPDPEPPDPGKRYPVADDPMCGPTGTLTPSGSITTTQAGQVIRDKDISGTVTINHPNCKLLNCKVTSSAYTIIKCRVDSVEIGNVFVNATGNAGSNGIDGRGHFHHNRIRGCENGINATGKGPILIEWNDIDKMGGVQGQAHYDCIQADGDINDMEIRNNRLNCDKGDTSGCMLDNYFGAITNVRVHDNFIGGGSYPAYLDGSFQGSAKATNITYTNNDMRAGGWGGYFYWKSAGSGCSHTGNKDWQTGASAD